MSAPRNLLELLQLAKRGVGEEAAVTLDADRTAEIARYFGAYPELEEPGCRVMYCMAATSRSSMSER